MISTSNIKTAIVVLEVLLAIAGICNAQTPEFSNFPSSSYIVVNESFPVGGLLFKFTVSHPTANVSVAAVGYYTTTLVNISQTQGNIIYVNVTTRVILDRDGNGQPGTSIVDLSFIAKDTYYKNERILVIKLYITDVNDNAPMFQNQPYVWEIPELPCNLSGNMYTSINATDLDNGEFGIIRYRMEPDQSTTMYKDTFSINNQSGYITMNKCVDYEERSYYRYTVFAVDNLGSGNNSTTQLIIKVIDMQDEPPFFKSLFYRTVLKTEDTIPGVSVITVNAFDGDRENSNQIEYSLQSGACSKYFSIDKDSGQVSVQHTFNITSEGILNSLCTLTVQATEKGEHFPQYGNTSASTTVDIYIQESSTTQAPNSQPETMAKTVLSPQFVSVVENSSQTLTCSYDGSEYVDVFRWQVDNVTVGDISATECRVLGSLNSSLYSYNCSSNNNYSVALTILRLTRFNQGNIWQCIIILRGKTDMSNTVSVDVTVPITYVQMQEPAADTVTVRENTQIMFVCVTSGGLPEAKIRWFKDNSVGYSVVITSGINVTTIDGLNSDKLKTVISTLQYSPARYDNNMTIYCTANNSVNTVVSERKPLLNVEYAPDVPPVILEGSSVHVIENTTQQLTCSITGGNPLPNITWSCYNGSVSDNSTGATVLKVVNWTTSRLHDGYCTCLSSHFSGIMSVNISVVILYPPTIPTFIVRNSTVYDTMRVVRNSNVSLRCVSDGNPAPTYTWTYMNSTIENQDLLLLADIQTSGQYTCKAENKMYPSKGSTLTGHQSSSLTVEILYAPEVQPFENINIVEGQNLSILCSIKPGNPYTATFAWTRTGDNMTWQTQALTIPYVSINDASNYTCSANNTMSPTAEAELIGIDSESFKLDVMYSYSVTMFTLNGLEENVVVSENATINVKCDVESNPGSNITIQHDDKTLITKNDVTHLDYSITQAKCTDAGSYTCTGINEFNMQYAKRIIRLFVQCSPRPSPFDPVIDTVTVRSGLYKSVTLNFTALAYPEPTASQIQWYRLENHIMTPIGNNVYTQVTNDGLHYNLTIAIVTVSSFGDYFLRIYNVFGSWDQNFYLEAYDTPSVPVHFNMLDRVENSVAVQWTPGFNGGFQQTFVLQYRKTGTNILRSVYISHHGEPEITYMIDKLSSGTQYELVLFAFNEIGRSKESLSLTVTTSVSVAPSPPADNGALIGEIFGGVFGSAIFVVFFAIFICYMRRRKKGNDAGEIDPNNRASMYMDLQASQHEYTNTSPEYSELNTTCTRQDGTFVNSGPHLYTDVHSDNSGAAEHVYNTINPSKTSTPEDKKVYVNIQNRH